MIKFNYILNDLTLSSLITKCLYSENVNYSDKEELENQIKLIQQENKDLKSQLRGTTHCYDEEEHRGLVEENKQLINNWNKLKEYARENLYFYSGYQNEDLEIDSTVQGILSTMQELEQGSGSDE